MTRPASWGMLFSIGAALLLHLLLFVMAKPSRSLGMRLDSMPPVTRYAMQGSAADADAASVRMVKSPVVFSLPTEMGFSRELVEHDVQTRKTFMQQQLRTEHFLNVTPAIRNLEDRLLPERLMISMADRGPLLPEPSIRRARIFVPARRVTFSPGLQKRIMGGIVLPPELNKAVDKPWMVRATVDISEQGAVEHLFLDHPLDPPALNHQVLRVLYGLRFKPGRAEQGSIEIYSPEASPSGRDAQ